MADIQYDVNLDALKEAASKTPAFDVYNPSDFYVNISALPSTADEHLPSVAIEGITPSFDQKTQDEKFNALIKQLLSEKSEKNLVAGGAKTGDMNFRQNADGTYSHTGEKGRLLLEGRSRSDYGAEGNGQSRRCKQRRSTKDDGSPNCL